MIIKGKKVIWKYIPHKIFLKVKSLLERLHLLFFFFWSKVFELGFLFEGAFGDQHFGTWGNCFWKGNKCHCNYECILYQSLLLLILQDELDVTSFPASHTSLKFHIFRGWRSRDDWATFSSFESGTCHLSQNILYVMPEKIFF